MFRDLDTLILSGNLIQELTYDSLRANMNLQFLSLNRNKLTEIKHLNHLVSLQYLDLSNN